MKVWIELPEPVEAGFTGEEICDKANKMLRRLGVSYGKFTYSNERTTGKWIAGHYKYVGTGMGSATTLKDNGKWFNLDYFGRDNIEIVGEIS